MGKMKISEEVRKALGRYPYLEEYLAMGVINHRALARELRRNMKSEANLQSIVSAIRRAGLSRKRAGGEKILRILSGSDVNLKYDLAAATIVIDQEPQRRIEEVHRALRGKRHMLLQGMRTLTVVAEEDDLREVLDRLRGMEVELRESLASVVVRSPEDIVSTPGVIAHIAVLLALDGINVVEMMSSSTETSFILEERDALRAVEVIRREIKRAREHVG
jgi:hypothetical protein